MFSGTLNKTYTGYSFEYDKNYLDSDKCSPISLINLVTCSYILV